MPGFSSKGGQTMIHTHPLKAALVCVALLTLPQAAAAQTAGAQAAGAQAAGAQVLVDATEVQSIAAIAREYGTAEVDKDTVGDPMLSGEMEGLSYLVFFYGCTEGADCQSIQFYTYWTNPGDVEIDTINAWNRDKRFAKAYLDDDGDPVLEMNVNLFAGVTRTNLSDTFEWWLVLMDLFEEYIGLKPADPAPAGTTPQAPATRDAGVASSVGGLASRQLKSIADWVTGQ